MHKLIAGAVFLAALFCGCADAQSQYFGGDVSQATSQSDFSCCSYCCFIVCEFVFCFAIATALRWSSFHARRRSGCAHSALFGGEVRCVGKQANLTFVIARIYCSYGAPDPDGAQTIVNARAAGVEAEGYIFPDSSAGNPQGQIQATASFLTAHGVNPKTLTVWLDIEGPNQYWSSNLEQNQEFIQGLISEAQSTFGSVGIYTSQSQWPGQIVPSSWTGASSLRLWYANYDDATKYV